jgi:hypothetical protein
MPDILETTEVETVSKTTSQVSLPDSRDSKAPAPPGPAASVKKTKVAPRMGRPMKLRLLSRLHGEGLVTWSASPVSVTYGIDVFGGGQARTASGFLDGDFTDGHADDPIPVAARLRLDNAVEVDIQITVVAPDLAEFEAPLTVAEADLLSSHA